MYVIKTRGSAGIPDYLQVRDSQLVLIRHVKINDLDSDVLRRLNIEQVSINSIDEIPFGVLTKI